MKLTIKRAQTFQPFELSIKIESPVDAAGILAALNASNNSLRASMSVVELDKQISRKQLLEDYIESGRGEEIYKTITDYLTQND